jgi:serine/threonine protein phosphatase 1
MSLIYAIGDVHGEIDSLRSMIDFVKADAKYWNKKPIVYFLGDIVDRGRDSLGCLKLVEQVIQDHPGSALHLGNHDDWFLEAVTSDGRAGSLGDWLPQGGNETLRSIDVAVDTSSLSDIRAVLRDFRLHNPSLVDMLKDARTLSNHGSFVFCHAGVDRRYPISDQYMNDLLWIRHPFLQWADNTSPVVVHGHTIFKDGPIVTDNRVSLDTGCYKTKRLSTLRIDSDRRDLTLIGTTSEGGVAFTDEISPQLLDRGFGTVFDRSEMLFKEWTETPSIQRR